MDLINLSTWLLYGRGTAADNVKFVNHGVWKTTGTSDFGSAAGAATNTLRNVGVIQAALDGPASSTTSTTFAHLGAFRNGSASATGTVTMINGLAGDVLTVTG